MASFSDIFASIAAAVLLVAGLFEVKSLNTAKTEVLEDLHNERPTNN